MTGLPPVMSPLLPAAPPSAGSGNATNSQAPPIAAGDAAPPASTTSPELAALEAAVAAATQNAAAVQDGLAVLMANVLRASATTVLPEAVQTAVEQLTALHLPTDQTPDAATVKAALQNSGLFTEAHLTSTAASVPVDVKIALAQLNQAATAWLSEVATPDATPTALQATAQTGASPSTPALTSPAKPQSQTPATTYTAAVMRQAVTPPLPDIGGTAMRPPAPPADGTASAPATPSAPAASRSTSVTAVRYLAPVAAQLAAGTQNEFKPVVQLLQQAVTALQSEATALASPIAAPAATTPSLPPAAIAGAPQLSSPTVPATNTAQPATPSPTVANNTVALTSEAPSSPASATPQALKIAAALVAKAVDVWPGTTPVNTATTGAQIAAPGAMPTQSASTASAPGTALNNQLLAQTTAFPAATDEIPAEVKAVLTLLGNAIAPLLNPPAPATANTANAGNNGTIGAASPPDKNAPPSPSAPDAALPAAIAQPIAPPPSTATLPVPTTNNAVPNDLRAMLGLLNKIIADSPQSSAAPPPANPLPPPAAASTDGRTTGPSAPPPVAGAPTTAQPAAAPSLPEHADALVIAKHLAAGSDAALARQTLLQIASLPDGHSQTRSSDARWMFDVPLMTPQGPAVAQMVIERDGSNAGTGITKPVWRVQFAIDIEPLGPVRANLAISGDKTWVTLAADRPESLNRLRSGISWLNDALQANALEAEIAFQNGATPAPKDAASRLVDHVS